MKQHIRIHKAEPNTGALDYSHLLEAPAGKHGFVQASRGHLFFEDGTRARFLGFNVAARSNTPDHETADKMAARFASMGVNIIRLHAADAPVSDEPCSWASCREAPLLDYARGDGRHFNPEGLDRFDYFAAKLKEKGIYLHIDLIVARDFTAGDGLDYPGDAGSCVKRFPMYNERMIELQQEYARELLCHVNPYTGLALIDDPAVVTIQINNEDSAIKGTMDTDARPEIQPYRDEVQQRFNDFLRMKYHTRAALAKAWTHEGVCALREDEDPALGTVRGVDGGFYQPVNEPTGDWNGPVSPARYADFMEFGIASNRRFYQRMKDFLHGLGVKVPIVCSNLLAGAADVYGHTDGDLMENNSYFNHPILPLPAPDTYMVAGPAEYVSTNPLLMQRGIGAMATTLLSLASVAVVAGKPFMLSEWNEYGEHPFHSTAYLQTIAYACLNDWDGLILYNHHTSENWDDQPADEIRNVFDVYNDPAVICQWGFLATVFLKGLISPAKSHADVVYTQNDLKALPNFHAMPMCFLPYITGMRNVFLDGGEQYQGGADVALNAGFMNIGDLSGAKHGIYYAWSPWRDALRKSLEIHRLARAAKGSREITPGVHLGDAALVFDKIAEASQGGDYRFFAEIMTRAMREWGTLPEGTGYVAGKLISDTKEIVFDPDHARFSVQSEGCACFSGAPEKLIPLGSLVEVQTKNERISLTIHATDANTLAEGHTFILTAMGTTGMDETTMNPGPEYMPGFSLTMVHFAGKLYAETLEGSIRVKACTARLEALSPIGEVLGEIPGIMENECVRFDLAGNLPALQYRLTID